MLSNLFGESDSHEPINDISKGKKNKSAQPPGTRCRAGFVGLDNQGATCYLNSLIQVMYMTPRLREGLFSIDPKELGVDLIEIDEKEQEEMKKKGIIEPNENLLQSLIDMGVDDIAARISLIETNNQSLEAAFDYLDRYSEKVEARRNEISNASKTKKKKPRYIPLELQRLFSELQGLNKASISTQELTIKGFQWQGGDGQVQHDAHELNRLLIDALEKSLKRTSGEKLCSSLYEGKVVNQILCLECQNISEREESFYDLNMQVIDCTSLEAALDKYCQKELLEGDSAYQCDICGRKTKAYRCTKIKELPEILTFSCNRFKIDKSTNWQRVKISSRSEYPLSFSMKHFVEDYDLKLYQTLNNHQVQKSSVCHSQIDNNMLWIHQIKKSALEFTAKKVETKDISVLEINEWPERLCNEFEQQYLTDFDLKSSQDLKYSYKLNAIIVHKGSAYSGHYYTYIRDSFGEGKSHLLDEYLNPGVNTINNSNSVVKSEKSESKVIKPPVEEKVILQNYPHEFYFNSLNNEYLIRKNSPLEHLISIFINDQERFESSQRQRHNNQSYKKTSAYYMTIPGILKKFQHDYGTTWGRVHRVKQGVLEDYLLEAPVGIFKLENKSQYSLNRENKYNIIEEKEWNERVHYARVASKEASIRSTLQSNKIANISASNFEIKSNDDHRIDEDELLARMLQESVNSGEISRINLDDNSNSDPWKVAGKVKAKKGNNSNPKLDNESNLGSSKPLSSLHDRLNLLAELLLAKTFGKFYEFNDTRVSPISFDQLANSFEGVNSSYLLVYERGPLLPHSINKSTSSPIAINSPVTRGLSYSTTLSQSPHKLISNLNTKSLIEAHSIEQKIKQVPIIPAFWQDKLNLLNKDLDIKRMQYEEHLRLIELFVYLPHHFAYHFPFLDLISNPSLSSNLYEIVQRVDQEFTFEKFLENIFENKDAWYAFLDYYKLSRETLLIDLIPHIQIHKLIKYSSGWFYPFQSISLKSSIESILQERDPIFIWLPSRAESVHILYGENAKPVSLNIFYLRKKFSITFGSFGSLIPNPLEDIELVNSLCTQYYIPGNYTFAHLLGYLEQTFQVKYDDLILYAMLPVFVIHTESIESSQSSINSNLGTPSSKVVNYATSVTADKVKLTLCFQQKHFLIKSSPNSPKFTMQSPLSELWFLKDLYLENQQDHDISNKSLVLSYVEFKSNSFLIECEVDSMFSSMISKPPLELSLAENFQLNEGTKQVEVSKSMTILQLKEICLGTFIPFHKLILVDHTRLRLGTNRGEDILTEENITLEEFFHPIAGKSYKVYLEIGSVLEALKNWTLNIQLIKNNSTDLNYSIAESGVKVSSEISLEISPKVSIAELRDLIGVKLCSFPPHWTKKERSMTEFQHFLRENHYSNPDFDVTKYKGYRLRKTSWLQEPAELLFESDKTSDSIKLKDTGVRSGDLILFEEGYLPVRGEINLPIYIWSPTALNPANIENSQLPPPESTLDSMEEKLNKLLSPRLNFLFSLGEVNISVNASLTDLYQEIFKLIIEKTDKIILRFSDWPELHSFEEFVISELLPSYLPGKRLWLTYHMMKKELMTNNSIKKLNLKNKKPLIIERLPQSQLVYQQQMNIQTSNAFRIWIQRLINPDQCSEGRAIMQPSWPPQMVTVTGGSAPTWGHLARPMLDSHKDINSDSIRIYKYNPTTILWVEMPRPSLINSKKKLENILIGPYNIKEGDNFCFFSLNEFTTASARRDYIDNPLSFTISLPEDIISQQYREEMKKKKSSKQCNSSNSLTGSNSIQSNEKNIKDSPQRNASLVAINKPKRKAMEIVLKLRFDFDDEEDQDD